MIDPDQDDLARLYHIIESSKLSSVLADPEKDDHYSVTLAIKNLDADRLRMLMAIIT